MMTIQILPNLNYVIDHHVDDDDVIKSCKDSSIYEYIYFVSYFKMITNYRLIMERNHLIYH